MSRATNECVFSAALNNEYQWCNLYLKQFGCCTYAPPLPKDPTTTAEGVYPLRRQLVQLNQTFSESDSDAYSETEGGHRTSLSLMTPNIAGRDVSSQSISHMGSSDAQSHGTASDQYFSLDLFSRHGSPATSQQWPRGTSKRSNGGRRGNRGATLRKDDFFDVNDAFSTKFFGFLWRQGDEDDDEDDAASDNEDGYEELDKGDGASESLGGTSNTMRTANDTLNSNSNAFFSSQRRLQQRRRSSVRTSLESTVHDGRRISGRLTFTRNTFLPALCNNFSNNPHGVHDAMLRLHHETWTMLMDNRLMTWMHRQTADHYRSATQLRQRLLDVVTRGPSTSPSILSMAAKKGSTNTATENFLSASTRTEEEALQCTFESFSPFFAVIAPPPAVQRAKDQFKAARRAQLRSGGLAAKTSPANIVGLPLFCQYGSWREAYEHRQRWSKAPFSFFFLHDCSYNYTQVTAVYVQLHLLYVHAHTHTHLCAEVKPESMSLQDASQQLTGVRNISRAVEFQRSMCPLTAMQEVTENIILAYEQSSSRTTLTMLRRVLDFLTDTALDVVTAHRFVSREALLRQSGFDLPGVEVQSKRATATSSLNASATAVMGSSAKDAGTRKTLDSTDDEHTPNTSMDVGGSHQDGTQPTGSAATVEGKAEQEGDQKNISRQDEPTPIPTPPPTAISVAFLEPQRVTEKDVNDLFELVYWFADTATANASLPIDTGLIYPIFDGDGGGDGTSAGMDGNDSPSLPPSSTIQRSATVALTNGRYIPGKEQVHNAVESFVQAVELLEAYRKPLWMQNASAASRGQTAAQGKGFQGVNFPHDERSRTPLGSTPAATTSSTPPPLLSADSFTGLTTPLVVLTTYLRLHGGQWLKQLCSRVFDTLRKQSVVLYVNTVDLDAMWAHLQDAPSVTPPQQTERRGSAMGHAGGRTGPNAPMQAGSTRGRRRGGDSRGLTGAPLSSAPPSAPPQASTPADIEAERQGFIEGLSRYEAVICQDILYAITEFTEALHGKRSSGRLPHGISVLLTQFVTTVHLFLLESSGGGGMGGGMFGMGDAVGPGSASGNQQRHNGVGSPSMGGCRTSKKPAKQQDDGHTTFDASPVRQVEERLRVCKERYYAGMRQHLIDSAEPYGAAFSSTTGVRRRSSRQPQHKSEHASSSTSAASIRRLIQTIEHHRLAKFILFDCWILPALNNAIALGYLAPDSPLHLRWNIDALARYLKVLLHAPFVEQDRKTFLSLTALKRPPVSGTSSRQHDSTGGGGTKSKTSGPTRSSRRKSCKSGDGRGQPLNLLTLPPYLTGIYDVATGSLVRLHVAPPSTAFGNPSPEASNQSSNCNSVTTKLAWATAQRSSLIAPETFNPNAPRPSFLLSIEDANELSGMENQHGGWGRPRKPLFEAFPTAVNADPTLLRKSLTSPLSSFIGGKAKKPRDTPPGAPGITVPPAIANNSSGEDAENHITEKPFLPPIALSADGVNTNNNHNAPEADREEHEHKLSRVDTPNVATDAAESVVPRALSPRRERAPSTTFAADTRADSIPFAMAGTDAGGAVELTLRSAPHPYIVVNEASWLDMSPLMQFLNEQLGLTCIDLEGEEEMEAGGLCFPQLPTAENRAAGVGVAAMTTGCQLASVDDDSFIITAAQRSMMEGLSAVQVLNVFCKAAAADESDKVVVSEFDVLPTMAAGCIEKLYDVVTGVHPMVARALQTGAFNFTRPNGYAQSPVMTDFSSLYSACLNGVLLHPRTAAHIIRNVFENSPAFGQTLMRPVMEGTALELLRGLVARHGETPMVDANSIVPLLQMSTGNATAFKNSITVDNNSINDSGGLHVGGGGCGSNNMGAVTITATGVSALERRWESESRRLLRQFAFFTTGFADMQRPLPLVPGSRRPVGPPHPIHMIRAGADRIAADTGGSTVPVVFDPWWRAMVVALCVKALNMFDECRSEHATAFNKIVHKSEEALRQMNRQAITHYIATKGKETSEKAIEEEKERSKRTPSYTAARRPRNTVATSSRRVRDASKSKGSSTSTMPSRKKPAAKRSLKSTTAASVSGTVGS